MSTPSPIVSWDEYGQPGILDTTTKPQSPKRQRSCLASRPRPGPPPPVPALLQPRAAPLTLNHVWVVLNPFSGNQRALNIWTQLVEPALTQRALRYSLFKTLRPGHAIQVVRDSPDLRTADALLVIGGDGTLNEVLNGLMQRDDQLKVPLGLIPGGTGNSVAVSLGVEDPEKALQVVLEGGWQGELDVGKCVFRGEEGEEKMSFMVNLVGWGLGVDANVTAEKLRWLGPLRYDVGAVVEILKSKKRQVKCVIDGDVVEEDLCIIMVQNNAHGGDRLRLAPFAKMDDGCLDVLLCPNHGRRATIGMFNELKRGGSHVYLPTTDYRRFKKLEITSEQTTLINIDGENCGYTPITVEVCPRALPFIVSAPLPSNEETHEPTASSA